MTKLKLAAVLSFLTSLSLAANAEGYGKSSKAQWFDQQSATAQYGADIKGAKFSLSVDEQETVAALFKKGAIRINKEGTGIELTPILTDSLIDNGVISKARANDSQICGDTW